jgi:predicted esterase YcpF (UPF0227 family)
MKILYLHGLGSGANSNTASQIAKHYTNDNIKILAPELPIMPKDAFNFILDLQKTEQPNIVIGTSLGGFYARYLHGPFKILVNPAMLPADIVNAIGYGTYQFFCPRQSGEKSFIIDETFVDQLKEIADSQDGFIDDEMLAETFALFGRNDTVISNYDVFKNIYRENHAKYIEAEHRLTDENIEHDLIPLIEYLRSNYLR